MAAQYSAVVKHPRSIPRYLQLEVYMKVVLPIAAAAALAVAAIAAGAQQSPVVDAGTAFAQIQPDMNGTVTQPIMHAPAGDVVAEYIGRAPRQVYSNQDELLYVISGHGTAALGYPTYQLRPGSVISIPRNTAFAITAAGNQPLKAIMIASPIDDPSNKHVLEP
jgi:mannose-6-phosphate isomerase-like protein (cupin superfamily)